MRVIIAGSREIVDYDLVCRAIEESGFEMTEVVSGRARGVDALGEKYALEHDVNLRLFPAEWDKYGKRAGYLRNAKMANYADALVAIWDGFSRGTASMIDLARRKGLKIHKMIICPDKDEPEIDFLEGIE